MDSRSIAKRTAWRTRASLKGVCSTNMTSGWNEGAGVIRTSMFGSASSWLMISDGAKYMMSISPVVRAETWAAYSLM